MKKTASRLTRRTLRALCTALMVSSLLVGMPGHVERAEAQVPTIDLSSLAKLKEMVGTANQQLGQLNSIFNTISQINRVIGAVGSGNIGGILSLLGLGNLNACIMRAQSLVGSLSGGNVMSIIGGASSALNGCSGSVGLTGIRPTMPSISNFGYYANNNSQFTGLYNGVTQAMSAGQTMGTASAALQRSLYLDESTYRGANSAQSVESMNAIRGIVARQSAVDAMAVAVQGRTMLGNAPQEMQALSDKAKEAKTLRDDIAVNNAIMLKILEQVQQLNANLAAQNQLRGAVQISNDGQIFNRTTTAQ